MSEETSHLFPTYKRWDIVFQEANGSTVIDQHGNEYIDMMSGIGVVNLGHKHPNVLKAVEEQLQKGWHGSNFFQYEGQERVAQILTENSTGEYVFFVNSGTEANEAAIKLARKYRGKNKVVSFLQSFHGRTFGSMAATGQTKIHEGFGSMLSGFEHIPYNDVEAVKQAVDEDTAAIMLEVVQGEGGIYPGEERFFQAVQEMIEKTGALLIIDEIQTGLGRTGTFFAYEQTPLHPDIITTAKSLGNGIPTGAVIGKAFLKDAFGPGTHGSTFGGNPLAMAAAEATLTTMLAPGWLHEIKRKGESFLEECKKVFSSVPLVKDVRGKGLMIGIELKEEAAPYILALQEKGVLTIGAGPSVIRLLPPLTTEREVLQEAIHRIKEVLSS